MTMHSMAALALQGNETAVDGLPLRYSVLCCAFNCAVTLSAFCCLLTHHRAQWQTNDHLKFSNFAVQNLFESKC